MSVFPWIASVLLSRWYGANFRGIAVCIALLAIAFRSERKASPLYGFTHPIGALIYMWMLLRSTVITLWRGGVIWRDTFYPLSELKKGVV